MPDISTATDAERVYSRDNLSALSLSHPLDHLTLSSSATMDANTKAATNGYTSSRGEQDPGTTLPPDDSRSHLSNSSPSSLAFANGSSPTHGTHGSSVSASFVPRVEKLSYSNYTFWYMSLRLAAAVYRCEDHILSDPPLPADLEGKDTHRRTAAQAWLLVTQSIPEEMRHQLTIDDLSCTPHTICEKLKHIVVSRPENSRVYLMSRAQNTILRQGDSMSDYLAAHDDIRQRMILVDHIKEDDEATTILFILCGLRQNPDYSDVYTSLSMKSAASSLTLADLRHDLLREEQYLKTKGGHPNYGNGAAGRHDEPVPPASLHTAPAVGTGSVGSGGSREGRKRPANGGMWCSFHEVTTHNTDQCQAKARQEAMGNKWCSFHECSTHDTNECKAKARQESIGTKWCSFHESHTHNTDECEAKRRQEDFGTKWCSFHESHTHNTDECQAKARHDALYIRSD